jgi:hypothetical protein
MFGHMRCTSRGALIVSEAEVARNLTDKFQRNVARNEVRCAWITVSSTMLDRTATNEVLVDGCSRIKFKEQL